jgi:hypothetical protein
MWHSQPAMSQKRCLDQAKGMITGRELDHQKKQRGGGGKEEDAARRVARHKGAEDPS